MQNPIIVASSYQKRMSSGRTKPCLFLCKDDKGDLLGEYVVKLKAGKVECTDTHFYIIFKQSDEYLKKAGEETAKRVGAKVEKGVENLSANEQIIYDLIKRAPSISKSNIATQGELSKKMIDYNIEKLKKKGVLRRIGPNKGGYWEVCR